MIRKLLLAVLGMALWAPAWAGAGPQEEPKPFADGTEQLYRFPVTSPKAPEKVLLLEGLVYRPAGPGPFKTVVMNHGSPRNHEDRRNDGRARYELVAKWFLSKGWAVVVPMRRGYAASEGEWAEGYGTCDAPDFHTAGLSTANDIGAVVRYVQTLDFVARDHLVVMGQSAGAWGTLATMGRNPAGVVAGIAVAPGRGSLEDSKNCAPHLLVESATRYGQKAKAPLLWLSTGNDHYFGVPLVRQMVDAYSANGAPVEFRNAGSYGRDGHSLLREPLFTEAWSQPVEAFLKSIGEM